jgi:hypothetical protein
LISDVRPNRNKPLLGCDATQQDTDKEPVGKVIYCRLIKNAQMQGAPACGRQAKS